MTHVCFRPPLVAMQRMDCGSGDRETRGSLLHDAEVTRLGGQAADPGSLRTGPGGLPGNERELRLSLN